jgi:hypothetical protein
LLPFQIGVPIQATAVVLIAVLAGFLYQKERPLETSTPEIPIGQQKHMLEQGVPPQAPGKQQQQRQERPLSQLSQEAQRQQQRSAPSSNLRPFGLKNPAVGAEREYSRVGEEQTVDHRLVVRLRTPVDSGQVAGDRLQPQARSVLSQQDVKRLQQARERVEKTGQTQSEVFTIPDGRYEQFKKELAAIGNIESDRLNEPQKSQSFAPKRDPLLIVVTIIPSTSPAEPGVR